MKILPFIIAAMPFLCGCFTSEQPFYDEGDIVTDDHIVGTFEGEDHYRWMVVKSPEKGYDVVLGSDEDHCGMKFTGTLFQIGTNRYFDLLPIVEQCPSGHRDAPTMFDIVQGTLIQPMHMVAKVVVGTNNDISVGCGELKPERVVRTASDAKEFFSPWQPPDAGFTRMIPETKHQREFLVRYGNDTNLFALKALKRLAEK